MICPKRLLLILASRCDYAFCSNLGFHFECDLFITANNRAYHNRKQFLLQFILLWLIQQKVAPWYPENRLRTENKGIWTLTPTFVPENLTSIGLWGCEFRLKHEEMFLYKEKDYQNSAFVNPLPTSIHLTTEGKRCKVPGLKPEVTNLICRRFCYFGSKGGGYRVPQPSLEIKSCREKQLRSIFGMLVCIPSFETFVLVFPAALPFQLKVVL